MALQSPFFGKRDADGTTARPLQSSGLAGGITSATSAASGSSAANASAASQGLTTSSASATQPASLARTGQTSAPSATATEGSAAKLTVGPNIKLKGVEITDCDTLVVEGTVEATMDSRVIHIAEQGAFSGSADIDIAEIHGAFDGKLTVRQKLVIHSTGRVTGTVRYGRLVIEDGGQLAGDVALGGNAPVQATLLAA
jgi:cytoskeletal protein CcmA (bactofilin family)